MNSEMINKLEVKTDEVIKKISNTIVKNGKKYFIGSATKLFDTKREIIEYFKANSNELVYFGTKFDCEPDGNRLKYKIEIED
jgi:hypothetical protein